MTQNCSKTRCKTKTTQKYENGVEKTPSPPPRLAERLLRSVTTGIVIMISMSVPQQQVLQQQSPAPRKPANHELKSYQDTKKASFR
jgi:hypothetical protein